MTVEDGEHHDDEDEDGDDDDHHGDVARDHAVVQDHVLAAAAAAGPGAGQQLLLHVRLGDQLGGGRGLGRDQVIYCPWSWRPGGDTLHITRVTMPQQWQSYCFVPVVVKLRQHEM